MSSRIGVDIGGTFTDFIVYDESGNKVIIDKNSGSGVVPYLP